MKITYAPNPMQTTIELDERDKEILRLKIILQEFKSHVTIARLYLKEGIYFDRTKAYAELHPANFKERRTARGTKQIIIYFISYASLNMVFKSFMLYITARFPHHIKHLIDFKTKFKCPWISLEDVK